MNSLSFYFAADTVSVYFLWLEWLIVLVCKVHTSKLRVNTNIFSFRGRFNLKKFKLIERFIGVNYTRSLSIVNTGAQVYSARFIGKLLVISGLSLVFSCSFSFADCEQYAALIDS